QSQVKGLADRMDKTGKGDAVKAKSKTLVTSLTAVEERLWNPRIKSDEDDLNYEPKLDHELTNLAGLVASADARPTPSEAAYYELLAGRLAAVQSEMARVVGGELAEFNRLVQQSGVAPVLALPAGAAAKTP